MLSPPSSQWEGQASSAAVNEINRDMTQREIFYFDGWDAQQVVYPKNLSALLLDKSGNLLDWGYRARERMYLEGSSAGHQYKTNYKMSLQQNMGKGTLTDDGDDRDRAGVTRLVTLCIGHVYKKAIGSGNARTGSIPRSLSPPTKCGGSSRRRPAPSSEPSPSNCGSEADLVVNALLRPSTLLAVILLLRHIHTGPGNPLFRRDLLVTLTNVDAAGSVPEVSEVAGTLRVAVGLVVRKLRQAPYEGELSLAESSALSRLERGGPATSSDLARLERIRPQSMGVTVAALLERGLIERSRDPRDGRRIVLSITSQGQQTVHDKRGARTEQIAAALRNGFSEAELAQLMAAATLLERLAEKL